MTLHEAEIRSVLAGNGWVPSTQSRPWLAELLEEVDRLRRFESSPLKPGNSCRLVHGTPAPVMAIEKIAGTMATCIVGQNADGSIQRCTVDLAVLKLVVIEYTTIDELGNPLLIRDVADPQKPQILWRCTPATPTPPVFPVFAPDTITDVHDPALQGGAPITTDPTIATHHN